MTERSQRTLEYAWATRLRFLQTADQCNHEAATKFNGIKRLQAETDRLYAESQALAEKADKMHQGHARQSYLYAESDAMYADADLLAFRIRNNAMRADELRAKAAMIRAKTEARWYQAVYEELGDVRIEWTDGGQKIDGVVFRP